MKQGLSMTTRHQIAKGFAQQCVKATRISIRLSQRLVDEMSCELCAVSRITATHEVS